ncbi:MAG: butyrate kinase [Eubacteriales bacterium]
MVFRMLVLNLGSTSTKFAVYEGLEEKLYQSISHSKDELDCFNQLWDQKNFRKEKIYQTLKENQYEMKDFHIIACRGGNIKPVKGGIYLLNEDMLADIRSEKYGSHPCGIGNVIAYEFGLENNISVIFADPPMTDELCNFAKYSGIMEITRVSSGHALNQKRTGRRIAAEYGKRYEDMNFIIAHLGGGISVGAHQKGMIIDMNNALDGDGPFSPERAGTLPAGDLIRMCYSGKYSQGEMLKKVKGEGGLVSYLGTNSGLDVEERIASGDEEAQEAYEAMSYQISKEIGAVSTVLKGEVDAIILTGSLAYSQKLNDWINERTRFIAPIHICPGENEMISLVESALRYLTGEEQAREY